ncbi:MAG: ABC transporter substrate-binding protein [Chloroflexi bacterium]|nr:ABC transporter substrate-binding protein [Chloroflexota bacterium]
MKRSLIIGTLTMVLALALVGCIAQQATPAPAKKAFGALKLGTAAKVMSYSQLYVAEKKGYFAEQGFESVEIVGFASGTLNQNAIQAGEVHLAAGAFSGIVDATAAGRPEVAVLSVAGQHTSNPIMAKATAQRLGITEKSSAAEKLKALKGLKLGITARGGGFDELARYMVIAAGLDPEKDAEIIPLGSNDAILAALTQGSIDVGVLSSPFQEIATIRGDAIWFLKLTVGEFEPVRDILWLALFGMRDFVEGNRDMTQAAVNAIAKASKLIRDNPNDAKAAVREVFPDIEQQVFDLSWENLRATLVTPDITKGGVEKNFKLRKEVWGQETDLRWDQISTNEFVERAKKEVGW